MTNFGPFFKSSEFDSPDERGSGARMQQEFISALNDLRASCGFPLRITSGFRTAAHNEAVKGSPRSMHLQGRAADIACSDSVARHKIVDSALKLGFKGIGIAKTFVHVDNRDTDTPVLWLY